MILDDITNCTKYSGRTVSVECDFKISDKCRGLWHNKISALNIVRDRNNGKDICNACASTMKNSGNQNHNYKYHKNEDFFSNIDSEIKAYLLGWIASDGHIRRKRITVKIHENDKEILDLFIKYIVPNGKIHKSNHSRCLIFDVISFKLAQDVSQILNLNYGKKDAYVSLPKLSNDRLMWCFLRGYFEGDGHIRKYSGKCPSLTITSVSSKIKNDIQKFVNKFNIKSYITNKNIAIHGRFCVEFLKLMYDEANFFLSRKYETSKLWINWKPKNRLNLSKSDILTIRNIFVSKKKTAVEIAKMYNMSITSVRRIVNKKGLFKE